MIVLLLILRLLLLAILLHAKSRNTFVPSAPHSRWTENNGDSHLAVRRFRPHESPALLPLLCLHSCLMHLPCPSVVSSPPSRVFVRPHFVPVVFVPARLCPLLRCVRSFPLVSFSFVFPSSPFLVQAIEGRLIIGSTSCRLCHSLLKPLGCLLDASWNYRNSFVPEACTLLRIHTLLQL